MSLPIILTVVFSIVIIFAIGILIIAKQTNFSTKQTIDPMPKVTEQKEDAK